MCFTLLVCKHWIRSSQVLGMVKTCDEVLDLEPSCTHISCTAQMLCTPFPSILGHFYILCPKHTISFPCVPTEQGLTACITVDKTYTEARLKEIADTVHKRICGMTGNCVCGRKLSHNLQ